MRSVDRHAFVLLRSQARSRAQQRPRLWKEYKRRRRARPGGRFTWPVWLVRLFWALMPVLSLPAIVGRVGTDSLLVMLALYSSGTMFLRAASLRNRLYGSTELFVALHYPYGDREFFRWQVREWLMSCVPVFLLSATSYLCVSVYGGGTALITSALLGGLAQTVLVVTLSLSQELWLTRIWPQPALALYALIAGILSFPTEFASLGGKALVFLPATWVNLWFASSGSGAGDVIRVLVPIGLLAALDTWLLRSLAKGYPRTDVTLLLQHAFHAEAEEPDLASLRNRTVAVEQLTKSDFDWNAGHWTTRVAGRWLTPRQRLVAEFLSADASDAQKARVKRAVQLAAAGVFLCVIPFPVPLWLSLCLFIAAAFTGAPLSGGTWPGLTPGWFGFARLQPLAGYPIGYVEASVSMMKVNAVRLLGFAPTALIAGLLIGWRYFGQPTTGLVISAQIVLMSFAVQPYCSMFLHSAGTNDTIRLNRTSVLLVCASIANAAIFIAAAGLFIVFNRSPLSWIVGPPVLALIPWSIWRFYGVLYSRRQIDLIPTAAG